MTRIRVSVSDSYNVNVYVGELQSAAISINGNALDINQLERVEDQSWVLRNGTFLNHLKIEVSGQLVVKVEGLAAPITVDASQVRDLKLL